MSIPGADSDALVSELQKWSSSKNGTRLSYLSALHAIMCRDRRAVTDPNAVADSPTIAVLTARATQYRVAQNVETADRRVAPIILVEGLPSGSVEDRLSNRQGDDLEEDDLCDLERFGIVENTPVRTERS